METTIIEERTEQPFDWDDEFFLKIIEGQCVFNCGVAVSFMCKQLMTEKGNAIVVIQGGETRITAIKEEKFLYYATAPNGRKIYARTPYHAALHVYAERNNLGEKTHYLQ